MGYTASFVRGSRTLTIDDVTYRLGQDFTPPGIRPEYSMGGGTSANRTGGADKFSTRYGNREWNFTIQVKGSNEAAIAQAVRQLVSIIEDESEEPLYFYYKGNTLPEPSWGQFGASLRYTVVSGATQVQPGYFSGDVRNSQVNVLCVLQIKPYADGKRVHVAKAAGYINLLGDGTPTKGHRVMNRTSVANSNLLFDPTGYNDWSASGNGALTKVYDAGIVCYGMPNATRYTVNGAGSITWIGTVEAGSRQIVAIYKVLDTTLPLWKPNWNGTALTWGTLDLGSNFYKLSSNFLTVPTNATICYANTNSTIAYDQVATYQGIIKEDSPNVTNGVIHGDMMGCAWSGTAYNSRSDAQNGYFCVPIINELRDTGAISVVHQAGQYGAQLWNITPVPAGGSNFSLTHSATGTITLKRAAGTLNVAYPTPTQGSTTRYMITYTPGTITCYVNGVAIGSLTNFGGVQPGTVEFGLTGDGDYRAITLYDHTLTESEIGSIDTQLSAAASGAGAIDLTPFWWTRDLDNAIDNAYSTIGLLGGSVQNFGVLAGIPGNHWARAELAISQGVQPANMYSINHSPFFTPPRYFFNDRSGAAVGSASGGSAETINIATTSTLIGSCNITDQTMIRDYVMGRDWYALCRIAGTNTGTINAYVQVNVGGQSYTGATTTIAHGTGYAGWRVSPVNVPRMSYAYDNPYNPQFSADMLLYATRAAAGSLIVDYVNFLPSPVTYLVGAASDTTAIIRDNEAMTGTASYGAMHYANTFDGRRVLDVRPNEYNNFVWHVGANGSLDNITTAGTLDWYITPRWSLL